MTLLSAVTAKAEFQVGAAIQDITPKKGLLQWGYSNRLGTPDGALDPLYARSTVFKAENNVIAIVQLDLGRVPPLDTLDAIRKRVRSIGVNDVFFTATHTHQAPAVDIDIDADYKKLLEKRLGDVIVKAAKKIQPAKIGVGRTEIDIAHNRRLVLADGTVEMVWGNPDKIQMGPVDKEAGIVKITDMDDKPISILVNYACHPVVLSFDHMQYSSDWCGEMARIVKEQTGAECLFLNGGCGDINPYLDKTPVAEGGIEKMLNVGTEAAYEVLAALNTIQPTVPETPSVKYVMKPVEVGTRWDLQDPHNRQVLQKAYGNLFRKYLANIDSDLKVPLSLLILNDNLAFAGMPGELFIEYQLELKRKSPLKDTFLVGYTNDFHVYFPTVKAASEGGYGANVNSYVGIGAGDKLVLEAITEIGLQTNRIRPKVELSDFVMTDGVPRRID
jgi:hypothetical protein